ncbi:MAG: hypothetical protein QXZ31_05625 [Thermofilaceae archaeon]
MKRIRKKEGRNVTVCFAAPQHIVDSLESDLASLQALGAPLNLKITMSFFLRLLFSTIYGDPELHRRVWHAMKEKFKEAVKNIEEENPAEQAVAEAKSG